jgi:cytidine deaminase
MSINTVIGMRTNEGYPCAQCRRVMVEFGLDWFVISGDEEGKYIGEMSVCNLVSFPFTPDALLG